MKIKRIKTLNEEQQQREKDGNLIFKASKVSILDEGKNFYWVESQKTDGKAYTVFYNTKQCDCPDYTNRLLTCKHWYSVRDYKLAEAKKIMKKEEAAIIA